MVYAADTLRDTLFTNWALTGTLAKTGSGAADMKETVGFYAYPQQKGQEQTKSVEVVKINEEQNEQVIEHPNFNEISDLYNITCRYRVYDIQLVSRDAAEADMEDMCAEIVRILRTVYNPSTSTGPFFAARRNWENLDELDEMQPVLIRTLRFTLTKVSSKELEVFHSGFGGVLVFDTSASVGDSKPAGDYTYTEVYNTSLEEGSETIGVMTRNSSSKTGKQAWARGRFGGFFMGEMMAKKSDVNGTTLENLNKIYVAQASGELGDVVLLDSVTSTEGSPATLTISMKMNIISLRIMGKEEDLVRFVLRGKIIDISTWTVV